MQHDALNVERPAKRGKESKVRLYERSLFFSFSFSGSYSSIAMTDKEHSRER